MMGNFNINKELLDAMRIIARQEIEKCNRDITKTARVINVNNDKTVKIEMDGKQYDNIPNYNGTTLSVNNIVKVTYPQGQASNMYVSGGGEDEIYSNLMKSYDLLISSTSTTGINQVVDLDKYREILLCATHSSNGTIYNAAMIPIGLFKSTSAGSMFRCSGGSFFAQCYTANGSITASVSMDGYCAKVYGIK